LAENVYECMFLLDANRFARDPNGISSQIPKMVEDCGGTVLASRLWNEQKLAYPINGQRKGTYWLTYFRMPTDQLSPFNRACQLNDNVLRNLTLKVEPRLVDLLVSHARGETLETPEEAEGAATEGAAAEGTATEGAAAGGAAAEGAAAEGTATEGTATEGTATEGTATEGTATEGAAAEGAAAEGTAAEGAATEGTAAEKTAESKPDATEATAATEESKG
jgi:small subunit ribosomal protein S6